MKDRNAILPQTNTPPTSATSSAVPWALCRVKMAPATSMSIATPRATFSERGLPMLDVAGSSPTRALYPSMPLSTARNPKPNGVGALNLANMTRRVVTNPQTAIGVTRLTSERLAIGDPGSLTTIIQTRIAPCGMLSTQRIQYPHFALGGPIESLRHEVGRRSSGGPNLDMLRGAARVSDIRAHVSRSRSTGLRTADRPRFRTWV